MDHAERTVRSTLVCVARNEARDIEEWVRFHRGIGFDRVVLYDHGSTDGTGAVAAAAGAEVIAWHEVKSWQAKAYDRELDRHRGVSDWIAFIDSDEFFVPVADGSVGAFLDRIDPHVAVALPWRCYGSGGHVAFPQAPVTRAFTRRGPDALSANRHAKVFVRPGHVARFINPHFMELTDGAHYVQADGSPIVWEKPGKAAQVMDAAIARINHYQVRSRAHYDEKLTRPDEKGAPREDRWAKIDRNDIEDAIVPELFGHIAVRAQD